ncbi:MAG: 4-hydroxy-3-methylbut-2-enyl diphosphate reductase [Kiritimatiellae bacterium]|nr:4-hydroxy-3-methylbut-2-enyl diphosphate reductase [Kiritimatiellia bacterium]
MRVEVINPHGFCAGVTHAIKLALSLKGVYCLHELVHNEIVVEGLKRRGFRFVEDIEEVPEGATVLFSAHGVSPQVKAAAKRRNLKVVDATCPFVERVHREARAFAEKGYQVVVIGNENHAEVKGILGEAPNAIVHTDLPATPTPTTYTSPLGVVSQTTMNADDVKAKVEELKVGYKVETMAQVCNATKERQDAVKAFKGDALLVLGSSNSSNTKRLSEVASCPTFRAGNMEEVRSLDFSGVNTLGVTSGASTPEEFFNEVIAYLEKL